jgi:hypothetical protein
LRPIRSKWKTNGGSTDIKGHFDRKKYIKTGKNHLKMQKIKIQKGKKNMKLVLQWS